MNAVEFSLLSWAAWAPGVEQPEHWREWSRGSRQIEPGEQSPPLKQIPAMLRRRLSRLSKMALQTVYECVGENHSYRTVFSSPHGEIHRTKKLLDEIVSAEPVSPMGFSLSVHNTASGLYSIASGNKAASTAVAAGVDSLEAAVIDAVALLHRDSSGPVLVVLADEPLPEFYRPFDRGQARGFALALLLGPSGSAPIKLALGFTEHNEASVPDDEQHGLQLLRFLCADDTSLTCKGSRLSWLWKKSHEGI